MRSISSIVSRARSSIVATAWAERSLSRSRSTRAAPACTRIVLRACPAGVVQLASEPRSLLGDHELALAPGLLDLIGDMGAEEPAPVSDQPGAGPEEARRDVVGDLVGVTAASIKMNAAQPAAAMASTGHCRPRLGRTAQA